MAIATDRKEGCEAENYKLYLQKIKKLGSDQGFANSKVDVVAFSESEPDG